MVDSWIYLPGNVEGGRIQGPGRGHVGGGRHLRTPQIGTFGLLKVFCRPTHPPTHPA